MNSLWEIGNIFLWKMLVIHVKHVCCLLWRVFKRRNVRLKNSSMKRITYYVVMYILDLQTFYCNHVNKVISN